MKIVYCIAGVFNSGGMERVLSLKANYLVARGYDVTIITTEQKGRSSFFPFDERIKFIDLEVNYLDLPHHIFGKILCYPIKQLQHLKKLRKVLLQIKADIVISMFDHEASLLHKINDGSKKVIEIHFSRFKRLQYARKGVWKWIDSYRARNDEKLAKKYDKFVVLTKEDAGYWKGVSNIINIPNPHSFEPDYRAQLTNKKVIAIGRLDYQKGFDELIKAWSNVKEKYSDWSLSIFGSGPLQEFLESEIIALKLTNQVKIHPPVSDIMNKYLESSILVMTSRYEGLPMALLEGQVCGLPLVSYACKCGPRDIIQNGINGFISEEGDQKGIALSLEKLMDSLELRQEMGANAVRNSYDYTLDKIMQQWEQLFRELL